MQSPTITIPLSAGRSVTFTSNRGRIRIIAEGGYFHPAEMAECKRQAIQRLADSNGAAIREDGEVFTPRRDPSNPGRNYQTRLIPPIQKEVRT